jgi:mevalonate kinase
MAATEKQIQTFSYHSNGKLMLSGEYLVLDGATALAMPLTYGQTLSGCSFPASENEIHWLTRENHKERLQLVLDNNTLEIKTFTGDLAPNPVQKVFQEARRLNPLFPRQGFTHEIGSQLQFDLNWGFGSSATLVSNIAWWAGVDPYMLNQNVFGGSGYDIACARARSPILYKLEEEQPVVHPAGFHPNFRDQLFFVYSGRKQNSREGILKYKSSGKQDASVVDAISEISGEMARAADLETFSSLMTEHEKIISGLIGVPPVKKELFPGFPGAIKSLGAWGGDFWMVTWEAGAETLKTWFSGRGYQQVFSFEQLALKK